MPTDQLAASYDTYVTADEVAREATVPQDDALRDPTTSILTTVCIVGLHRFKDED